MVKCVLGSVAGIVLGHLREDTAAQDSSRIDWIAEALPEKRK
jgi:hypothetical protein